MSQPPKAIVPALKDGEETIIEGQRFWRPVTPPGEVPRDRCIHEAGHTLASWWTGKGIARVQVTAIGEDGLNFTEAAHCYIEGEGKRSVEKFCKRHTRQELNDRVTRELIQIMAGPMAEAKHKGYGFAWQALAMDPGYRQWREGDPPSDLHAWTGMSLLPKPKDRARVANAAVGVCAHMLAFYWPKIEAIADALQSRRSLTGAEVLEVIGEDPRGPLCKMKLAAVELTAQ